MHAVDEFHEKLRENFDLQHLTVLRFTGDVERELSEGGCRSNEALRERASRVLVPLPPIWRARRDERALPSTLWLTCTTSDMAPGEQKPGKRAEWRVWYVGQPVWLMTLNIGSHSLSVKNSVI